MNCGICNGNHKSSECPSVVNKQASGRGPDKKPRVRRSKAEILAAYQERQASRGQAQLGSNLVAALSTFQQEQERRAIEATVTVSKALNAQTNAVEYVDIDPVPSAEHSNNEALNTASIEALASKIAGTVLDQALARLEQRSNEILSAAKQAGAVRTVVAAIKINSEPTRTLKHEAHPLLVKLVSRIKIGIQPLLVGPAGAGKTLLAEQAAEALGLNFGHLCFSAGVSEVWLSGRHTPNGFIEADFSRLYKNGGLFLADELDAADPNVLMSINTALANGHYYNPQSGESIKRHPDFVFVGAANTAGKGGNAIYTGRSRLDGATLDRLRVIHVTYLKKVEDQICPDTELADRLRDLRSELKRRGSDEIVSYRMFVDGFKLKQLGLPISEIIEELTGAWPQDLVKEVCRG